MSAEVVRPFKSRKGAKPPPADGDLIDECPISCLGENDGRYYFLSKSGELRSLAFRDFSRNGIVSLFGGKTDWLNKAAPDDKSGFSAAAIAALLMRLCAGKGIFDPATVSRGLGVWAGDGDAGVVAHCGDVLWVDGAWARAGVMIDNAIYAAGPKIERPDFNRPAGKDVGMTVRAHLSAWRCRQPAARELLLGYVGCAALGSTGSWHPHLLVIGDQGSGKTTLIELLAALLGDQAVDANNLTGPALYQTFSNTARCFLFDEQDEPEEGYGKVQTVIDILRQMSSGKGAGILRGGSGGKSNRYSVVGSALMAGIHGVILKPEDRARITEVELLPLPIGVDALDKSAVLEWAAKNSAGLRARCILRLDQYRAAFAIYRGTLLQLNCSRRQADQFAALLAGRDILLFDAAPETDSAIEQATLILPLINDQLLADAEEGDPHLCWTHLLSSPLDSWTGGDRRVLSALVMEAMALPSANNDRLGAYGLRLDLTGKDPPAVLVANTHQGLERIFAGSRWSKGKWRRSLVRLQDATPHETSVRFQGLKSRCVRVPVMHLPKREDGGS